MSRYLICVLALAGCADVGPFRASGGGDSIDGGVGGSVDAPPGSPDAPMGMSVTPVRIATSVAESLELRVSGGNAYWLELAGSSYAVARVPVGGGQVQRLASTDVPMLLASADGLAFWTTSANVMAGNSALTAATQLAPGTNSIAVSAQHVYFAHRLSSTWSIERVPRGGGATETLYANLSSEPRFGGGASSFYWLMNGELRRTSFTSPTTYAVETTGIVDGIFVGGATVCWVTQPDPNSYSFDTWCMHGGQKLKVATADPQIFELDVSDDAVYIAARIDTSTGRIRRYDFATKQLSTPYVATGHLPTSLAHDASHLYWIDGTSVWRQALTP